MEGLHASHPAGGVHRSNRVLGGAEQVVDETGQKMKDEFLTFLETYICHIAQDNKSHPPCCRFHEDGPNAMPSGMPTSDMLTGTEPPQMTSEMPTYRQQLFEMKAEGTNTLYVDFNHLFRYNDVMANAIANGYYRY
jgi:hypothetical protein